MKKLFSSLRGFTLVEIMLAAAILVAVMAAFLTSFTSTFRTVTYSQGISLAGRATENKLEEMVESTFDLLLAQYGPNSTGRNFIFNASRLTGAGIINVTDRKDLYGGNEYCVNSSVAWPARSAHALLVYDNRMWVMGGSPTFFNPLNDVWYSSDGANWIRANPDNSSTWQGRYRPGGLVYGNKMWIIGGSISGAKINDVWYSNDGVVWYNATNAAAWSPREVGAALVYDNKMWILGGINSSYNNLKEVWSSSDGVNWTPVNLNAPWAGRFSSTAVVYDNRMWILGGRVFGGGTNLNDVWYSNDGINWTCATANASWLPRQAPAALVYDNKMWIMGGGSGTAAYNDVWYSTDGANWICATNNTSWDARYLLGSAVVYDNKIWVMGGYSPGFGNVRNDVWSCPGYNRILEASIAISWKHPDGRRFGEDADLDGVWNNTTEDANGNGFYDSPAQVRALLVENRRGRLRRIYMGR